MWMIIEVMAVALSLLGTLLVARRKIEGFYFWIGGGLLLVAINFNAGLWGQVLLFIVYIGLSIWGIRNDRKDVQDKRLRNKGC